MQLRKKDNIEPKKQFPSLRDAMSRLFDESFWGPSEFLEAEESFFPKADMIEKEKEIEVKVDIPGIDPKKIDIEADENSLTLSGKTEEEEENEDKKFYRYERSYGEFRRDFALPSKIDPENISAKAKDGVLTITLPKTNEERKKKIEVE